MVFLESTTAARIFEGDQNRSTLLSTDERQSQTTTILWRLALHASGKVKADGKRVANLHRTAQRLLERREIQIPSAERLLESIAGRIGTANSVLRLPRIIRPRSSPERANGAIMPRFQR